jgi:hypothetical protein
MKFIISENKLQRFIFNKLNNLKTKTIIDANDGEIFVQYNGEDYHGAFNYDPKTKELFVDPQILTWFEYFKGNKSFENYEPVRVWFEIKYGVDVDSVISWDW